MGKKVRIGFIGAGAFISSRHLKTAGETPSMEIRAIADLKEELLDRHSRNYNVTYVTNDYHRLLEDKDIDLLVIGTRQDTHAKLIVEGLDSGKWVWCEKPICEDRTQEAAILDAEKRAAGRLAVGFNRRFAPAITKIREILKDLPQPWIISYRLQSNGGYKKIKGDNFYYERAHIIYEGCHILDLATFIVGEAPCRVYMTSTGNDNDVATLEYRNGARFSLVMTATAGSGGMEKEAMDIFTPGGAMSMRDFVELRIRGIKGQHDCLFEPHRCQFAKDVLQWGYDFWQLLINRLVLEDATESQPIVPVALAAEEQPFGRRVEEITKVMAGRDWRERNLCGDKGWTAAFRHFAQACAENAVPETATGYDGCLANEIGYALLESAKRGIPVDFDFRR